MLKRYQVLLNDWLADYLKATASKHDISFSEIIRLAICLYAGEMANTLHPEYKFPFPVEKIKTIMRNHNEGKIKEDEMHKVMSQIYFEAHKALEYITEKKNAAKK